MKAFFFMLLLCCSSVGQAETTKIILFGGVGAGSEAMRCWAMSAKSQLNDGALSSSGHHYEVEGIPNKGAGSFAKTFRLEPGVKYIFAGHSSGSIQAMNFVYNLVRKNPGAKDAVKLVQIDGDLPHIAGRPAGLNFEWYRAHNRAHKLTSNNMGPPDIIAKWGIGNQMRELNDGNSSCVNACRTRPCLHYCFLYKQVNPNLPSWAGQYKAPGSHVSLPKYCNQSLAKVDWAIDGQKYAPGHERTPVEPIRRNQVQ